MIQPDIHPLRQELRTRLFQGELGKLAVPVKYQPKGNGEAQEVPMKQDGLVITGRGTQLSDAMMAFADTKLDMALGIGHQRDNMLRANRALETLRETAGSATSQIVILTDALVRDVLSSHGLKPAQGR